MIPETDKPDEGVSMLPDQPLVSIIMAAHNAERFIREAIQSILTQNYPHWELLIMDDASSDGTPAVIRSFHDSRIRYYKLDRIGRPSGVRNAARSLCRGAFVMFFDADDILLPGILEAYVQTLRH